MNKVMHKVNKIFLVVFITLLIWVWADLALEQKIEGVIAIIEVREMPAQNMWITLNGRTNLEVSLTVTGPHARVAELQRRLRPGGESLMFTFDARQMGRATAGSQPPLDLVSFIQNQPELTDLGLNVSAVEPAVAEVMATPLEPKTLRIRLIDNNNLDIFDYEKIEPDQITMPVPSSWTGEKLVAFVQLSPADEERARLRPIEHTPYVELVPGIRRDADRTVSIQLRSEQVLRSRAISPVIGFVFSPMLQGRFRVQINDEDIARVMAGFTYSATDAAEAAYKAMPHHLLLTVDEKDRAAAELITRRLTYNFPMDSVERGEIMPLAPAPEVRFKLVPVADENAPSPTPPAAP
ncbi:MAG TPA: hypothetical protein VLH60_05550 [Sedimentisphaerales bacterium]|nr:hypothetical protein [Sedimentisphaerales bacterium]